MNSKNRTLRRIAAAASLVLGGAAVMSATVTASGDDEDAFTVAVVTPSAANDLAFSQSMIDALERMKDDGVIDDYVHSENLFVIEDAASALRGYAEDGHDLVIGHGSQYGGSLEEIAQDFPDIAFAWGTDTETFGLDNVSAYEAASDEGAYVMGAMAAMLAGDGSVGIVGPIEVGDAKLYVDGFAAGVAATDADVGVGINYTDSFSDTALASEAATTFIDGGATVLTGTAQMTVGAIGVANDRDVLWFGTQSSQTQLAPEIVVANQVYLWEVVLTPLVEGIKGGETLGGESYSIDLANGGLEVEYNPDFDIPDDVVATAEDLAEQLASGELETGVAFEVPADEDDEADDDEDDQDEED